jgi:hypothetical protein
MAAKKKDNDNGEEQAVTPHWNQRFTNRTTRMMA